MANKASARNTLTTLFAVAAGLTAVNAEAASYYIEQVKYPGIYRLKSICEKSGSGTYVYLRGQTYEWTTTDPNWNVNVSLKVDYKSSGSSTWRNFHDPLQGANQPSYAQQYFNWTMYVTDRNDYRLTSTHNKVAVNTGVGTTIDTTQIACYYTDYVK